MQHDTQGPKQTCVIAAVQLNSVSDHAHRGAIEELGRLLKTLGYKVVGAVSQRRRNLTTSSVLGQGKLMELAQYTGGTGVIPPPVGGKSSKARAHWAEVEDEDEEPQRLYDVPPHPDGAYPQATIVVVDHEISPRQARNLELAMDAEVLDRTGVIVEIFHRHAKTREARLQVEIARLKYVTPRMRVGTGGSGERQQGKGAGESSLELDRRRVRDRLAQLREELANIEREEAGRRARRSDQRRVALVGYTNAGKSSLMRALTGSQVLVQDQLFATLGTTVRALYPEVRPRVLVSDTVGFINKLPHDLVASFRSTLDEALEASLLLYVVDCADDNFAAQLEVTQQVLSEIGADVVPSRIVLNKVDKVDELGRRRLKMQYPDAIQLSAHDAVDVDALRMTLIEFFERELKPEDLFIPYAQGHVIGVVREHLRVLEEEYDGEGTHLKVIGPTAAIERVRRLLDDAPDSPPEAS